MQRDLPDSEQDRFEQGFRQEQLQLTDEPSEPRSRERESEVAEQRAFQGVMRAASIVPGEADLRGLLSRVLDAVEEVRDLIVSQHQVRDYYGTDEVARILDRAPWTVREWCRLGRVRAQKRHSGRGRSQEWVISHEELGRIRREGLLPLPKY